MDGVRSMKISKYHWNGWNGVVDGFGLPDLPSSSLWIFFVGGGLSASTARIPPPLSNSAPALRLLPSCGSVVRARQNARGSFFDEVSDSLGLRHIDGVAAFDLHNR